MNVKTPCIIEASDTKTVYVVRVNTDLTEGRGLRYVKHVTALRATALRLASRADVQGSDAEVYDAHAYLIGTQWYAPAMITDPTADDEEREAVIRANEVRLARRDDAIEKARSLGLSDEDLAYLRMETKA